MRETDESQLRGHANVRADICFSCGGKLKAADGSYYEALYDDGFVVFAAAICRECKNAGRRAPAHAPGEKPANQEPMV
jgi:hypothetical protein